MELSHVFTKGSWVYGYFNSQTQAKNLGKEGAIAPAEVEEEGGTHTATEERMRINATKQATRPFKQPPQD